MCEVEELAGIVTRSQGAVHESILSADPDRSHLQRPADRTSSFTFVGTRKC